ncbi:uncharacterized protein isoform X2 [Macaca fascicularis]|uniref:uncharacterized protein isoform X2 n=1 Tax=Macaca fascicularis TaxID=9541 RepID=UPI003D15B87F
MPRSRQGRRPALRGARVRSKGRGPPASPRVQVRPGLDAAAPGVCSLSCPSPPRSSAYPRLRGPLFPALPAALGRPPRARPNAPVSGSWPRREDAGGHRVPASPRPRSRPTHEAPAPIVEAPPGKEVRLPLQAAPRGIGNRQEMTRTAKPAPLQPALAFLKTSSSHQSLASPYPESPAQVKEPKRKARSHTLLWLKP